MSQDDWLEVKENRESYRAFLLRCWYEHEAGQAREPAWRFTLVEEGDEAGKRGFASLDELVTYLRDELR